MSAFFGPLRAEGRVPPRQQTRVAAFLVSAHGALARQFAFALPARLDAAWQTELNAQFYRESEIVSLLHARDLMGAGLRAGPTWRHPGRWPGSQAPIEGIADQTLAHDHRSRDARACGPCRHPAGGPAADEANANDPFVMALRRIEFESGRLLQAQILFLKGADLAPFRDAVSAAARTAPRRGAQALAREALAGVGIAFAANDRQALTQIKGASLSRRQHSLQSPSPDRLPTGVPLMKAVSVEEAVAMIPAGASIMVGGFMGVGTPERLLDELVRQKKTGLSLICNDAATPGKGVGKLFEAALGVKRMTATHIGLNPKAQQQMLAQPDRRRSRPAGHLRRTHPRRRLRPRRRADADRRRNAGRRRQAQIEVDGKPFLLETALRAQFALVHAFLADYLGNLSYALTSRNFNPVMAMAADTVIVTAETHRARRRHRARSRRDPGAARRLPHCQRVRSWIRRPSSPGAWRRSFEARQPRQSRHRHSDAGRELRSGRTERLLPVGERTDRHRADSRAGHGASAADGCRRPADQRAAGCGDLRQRDVVRTDPRRPCRRHRARRPPGRCAWAISPTG